MDHPPDHPAARPGVRIAHGADATEAVLLAHLDRLLDAPDSPDPLSRLALPVRVVVPSTSLRQHLGATLARRRGAVLGVTIQHLFAAAGEILERCGAAAPWHHLPGDLPYEVLVRRLARQEPELSKGLDFLVEGYGAVSGTVRDLLDAGLEPVLADAADEALADALGDADGPPLTAAEVARARALVRVAARVDEEMERYGVVRRNALLRQATDLLARDPERALPARALLVHGFADATGLATDFLEALLRHRGALLLLDAPPDPADPASGRRETAFGERFRERLSGVAGVTEEEEEGAGRPGEGGGPAPPAVERFAAPGGEAEAREVAVRVRRLLDGGATPERIAVVAREIEPHALALRRHFRTLGVPWSGVRAPGSLTHAGRRAHALLELLQRRGDLATERWLDAVAALPGRAQGRPPYVDLRLAFAATGRGRLRDAAALDLDAVLGQRDALPLPVRTGLSYRDAGDGEDDDGELQDDNGDGRSGRERRTAARADRRRVPRPRLAAAVATAAATLEHLEGWPDPAPPALHAAHLRDLLARHLGWPAADAALFGTLEHLERDLPADLPLSADELRLVLTRALEDAGRDPLGGRGGGVQALSVVEARGRTFEHLFLVGVHRGAFPRTVRQDPLLPDELRDVLARVLPDVPRKSTGFDEERYLFAQLLSAAPRVTLSWQLHDDDGQPLAPSPLVERLSFGADPGERGEREETPAAPSLYSATPPSPSTTGAVSRPAREEAILAALRGASRERYAGLLTVAVEEARRPAADPGDAPAAPLLPLDAARLAAARLAVLEEVDPDPERRRTLGPYLGFLGNLATNPGDREHDDPRHDDPWLTHVENLAACPWQLFLRKLLRVEPTPDPLQALPGADPLLLGNVVHAVLERLVERAGARHRTSLDAALAGEAVPVPWPGGDEIAELCRATARRVLADEGMDLPGLARALALRARPYVEAAGRLDWPADGAPLPVLGAEIGGELTLRDAAGGLRSLRFRADRVDAAGGPVRLTDYKTGRPLSTAKRDSTVARHHLEQVRRGTRLQATAYHRAAGEEAPGRGAVGRYLFLDPELERAEFAVGGDAEEARRLDAALGAAAATALAAWDTGAFFPRVVDPTGETEPTRCSWCEVAEACVRGDSGARLRLAAWNLEHAGIARHEAELAHHEVWRLATGEGGDGDGDDGEGAS